MSGVKKMKLKNFKNKEFWREDAFLHQLSMNGALLLTKNHDPLWDEAFRSISGRPDVAWERESRLLMTLPAFMVRRALWRASFEWWTAVMSYREELARYALYRGLLEDDSLSSLDYRLNTAAKRLGDLAWCATDTDSGQIEVIE